MLSSNTTHYRDLYFEQKKLSRISGEPSFTSLQQVLLELKANALSVPSQLGGGAYGFIGIIIFDPTYATLALMTPLITPVQLGPLRVAAGDIQYQIALAKTLYEEATRIL